MKEYQIGELLQHESRTLMCVEGNIDDCCRCFMNTECQTCSAIDRIDNTSVIFTNKLIFSAEGIKLQIKRKSCKVKVKVLELGEGFKETSNDKFEIFVGDFTMAYYFCLLRVCKIGDKDSITLNTEQEAIDWVDRLFSLRGE